MLGFHAFGEGFSCQKNFSIHFRGVIGPKAIFVKQEAKKFSAIFVVVILLVVGGFSVFQNISRAVEYPKGDNGCVPYAILGENKNLNFVCDDETYVVGDVYVDNVGETVISAVYNVLGNSDDFNNPEWIYNDNVVTVNMTKNFTDNFHPKSLNSWFRGNKYLGSVSGMENLDTSQVTDMSYLFDSSGFDIYEALFLDLSGWDTSKVINMEGMFYNMPKLATIIVGSGWNTDAVTKSDNMFYNNISLIGGEGTRYSDDNVNDVTFARIDGGASDSGYLAYNVPVIRVLSFDANGGENAPINQTCLSAAYFCTITTLTIKQPTRDGYTFLGWSESDDAAIASYYGNDSYTIFGTEKTLYAIWQDIGTGGITWEQKQTYTKGDSIDAILRVDYQLANFQNMFVDGEELDEKNYSVVSGDAAVVTLKYEYLETLISDMHSLEISFEIDGEEKRVTTDFIIQEKEEIKPKIDSNVIKINAAAPQTLSLKIDNSENPVTTNISTKNVFINEGDTHIINVATNNPKGYILSVIDQDDDNSLECAKGYFIPATTQATLDANIAAWGIKVKTPGATDFSPNYQAVPISTSSPLNLYVNDGTNITSSTFNEDTIVKIGVATGDIPAGLYTDVIIYKVTGNI